MYRLIQRLLRLLLRVLFGYRAFNEAVLQTPGPVLLVPNHVSWLDWLFVAVCLDPDWKFVVSQTAAEVSWLHRKIMLNRRTFPVETTSPYAVKRLAEYLRRGGRLVLFAEGRLSRTGCLMKLFDGTGFLLHKTGAKVITCYLRGAYRLPFSPNPNQKKLFARVTAHFSEVLTPPQLGHLSSSQARAKLTDWLRDQMVRQQFETETAFGPQTVLEAVTTMAAERPRALVLEDLTGRLSARRLVVGARVLAGRLASALNQGNARVHPTESFAQACVSGTAPFADRVGVLLPNVKATPVVLLALWALGKVPTVLNYSVGSASLRACAELAGLRHIVTSRAFLERARLDWTPLKGFDVIALEDLRRGISWWSRLKALARVCWAPRSALRLAPPQRQPGPETTAVILFTSGSEGAPKGVELTHRNLLANIRQVLAVCDLHDADRVFNALPLFHSFGLTIGTLLPLTRGVLTYLYPSPLHYRVVPTMVYFSDSTVLLGTNTFLAGYARKAHPLEFRSVRYLFAGAEKLQDTTARIWAERFGVRVLEGYGATECSPVISVDVPAAPRYGSAGRLLPGMEWRLDPVEGVREGGRLLVRGPNVMRGYLNPEANAQFQSLGGWYDTGDIVRIDEDGYLYVLGRLKRFAKISGEMVSLTAVEDALAGAFPHYGLRCQVAVVSRPDTHKGEQLVAVTNEPRLQLSEIWAVLRARGFPNLCMPRELRFLAELPKLGTGKLNHRALQQLIESDALSATASGG